MSNPEIKLNFERFKHVSEEEKLRQFKAFEELGWREGQTGYQLRGRDKPSNKDVITLRTYFWPHDSNPAYPDGIDYELVQDMEGL